MSNTVVKENTMEEKILFFWKNFSQKQKYDSKMSVEPEDPNSQHNPEKEQS